MPPTSTVILPVVAPEGTVAAMRVADAPVTEAMVPLNLTTLLPTVVLKLVPVIFTDEPTAPVAGVKEVMVGGAVVLLDQLVGHQRVVRVDALEEGAEAASRDLPADGAEGLARRIAGPVRGCSGEGGVRVVGKRRSNPEARTLTHGNPAR